MDDFSNEIASNLERAETNLNAARDLLEKGYFDIAASRAYYAAFYSASALLLKQGLDTTKHSGVIALIHQHFVKRGILEQEEGKNSTGCSRFEALGTMAFPCMLRREMHIGQ